MPGDWLGLWALAEVCPSPEHWGGQFILPLSYHLLLRSPRIDLKKAEEVNVLRFAKIM